jgi:hypothetical protein
MSATGMDIRGQGPNAGNGILYADGVAIGSSGVVSPKTVVNTTITFDPPSLATGAVAVSSGLTVTGVAIGDHIELYPPYDTQGVAAQGQVSAANTIVISLHNRSAGTVDLASGTWGVVAKRRV